MAINHKFLEEQFPFGLQTHNAILDVIPGVDPEVLVLGTFNPDTAQDNHADFFYGRNFFWRALFNLFQFNNIHYTSRRMPTRGQPMFPLDPTLEQIVRLTTSKKITFADLILRVLHAENAIYEELPKNKVSYNNVSYSLIDDNDLSSLNVLGQVDWNTDNIIKFLHDTTSIKTVYLTRQPNGPFGHPWERLQMEDYGRKVEFFKLFTPSGRPLNRPVMQNLIQHWLFNDTDHIDRIDHEWLMRHGVQLNVFANL